MSQTTEHDESASAAFSLRTAWPWLIAVALMVVAVYSPVRDAQLTNWDDEGYVLANPYIRELSWPHVQAMFTTPYKGNYHPLTMLSLAVDFRIGGVDPWPYHATNVLLHVLNALLVFTLVGRLFGSATAAGVAALAFGLHPMHVESVAWVSERKDVLYAAFFLAALLAYLRCLDRSTDRSRFYALSLSLFLCALLSKGMAVALAPSLLAIDWSRGRSFRSAHVWIEKVPYFALALGFGVVALAAQAQVGQLEGVAQWRFVDRLALAAYGYFAYLKLIVWPSGLSAFHPYPEPIDGALPLVWFASLPALAAVAVVFALSLRRARPLAFGLAFFTFNVIFVLQLVPVGGAIIADRYTYVASIGLCAAAGAGVEALRRRGGAARMAGLAIAVVYLAGLSVACHQRVGVWRDSITLWNDVIERHPRVPIAYLNRALARHATGDPAGAVDDLSAALEYAPDYARAWAHRGVIRHQLGDDADALMDLRRAVTLEPSADNLLNRGSVRLATGNRVGAIADFDAAIALAPGHVLAYANRGHARAASGDPARALADFERALQLAPGYASARHGAGDARRALGDPDGALAEYDATLALDPAYAPAWRARGTLQLERGEVAAGCQDLRQALALGDADAAPRVEASCTTRPGHRVEETK